ncbi:MAG: hypothetical protein KTR16_02720 [Acidiferrobacterales bacterium]|nr:hypothetical protein [Acidiferrobacterales bacterium]
MWNLVLFVSRAYFLRLLAVFILLAAPVVQAQQVTFQGAIERPAGAFATEAVSGEIEFKFLFGESVYEPFTIPANNSKTAYSKIIPLSQEQIDNVFVSVYARCRTNCETSNISTEIPYISPDDEQYGVAGGNNSYIANLTLPRKNNYLSGWITLPNNLVADSDIEIELIADSQIDESIVPLKNFRFC